MTRSATFRIRRFDAGFEEAMLGITKSGASQGIYDVTLIYGVGYGRRRLIRPWIVKRPWGRKIFRIRLLVKTITLYNMRLTT